MINKQFLDSFYKQVKMKLTDEYLEEILKDPVKYQELSELKKQLNDRVIMYNKRQFEASSSFIQSVDCTWSEIRIFQNMIENITIDYIKKEPDYDKCVNIIYLERMSIDAIHQMVYSANGGIVI